MGKVLRIYKTKEGKASFEIWLEELRDVMGRAKIKIRVERVLWDNFGDHRSVGGGVIELRINYGPGYRVYLARHGEEIVVLLCGGDKSTQEKDIAKAHTYWTDYRRRL